MRGFTRLPYDSDRGLDGRRPIERDLTLYAPDGEDPELDKLGDIGDVNLRLLGDLMTGKSVGDGHAAMLVAGDDCGD